MYHTNHLFIRKSVYKTGKITLFPFPVKNTGL